MRKPYRDLEEITDAEKIELFDCLYEFAREAFDCHMRQERFKDAEHYAFEALLENTVANDDLSEFWNLYNSVDDVW